MADWRQVQARIRKAKASSEAPKQLAELYERTRDAMVAFELAQWQEKAGDNAEAARWYTIAAERFRRAQWRTKAEAALTRLGAPVPVSAPIVESGAQTEGADHGEFPTMREVSEDAEPVEPISTAEHESDEAPSGKTAATSAGTEPGAKKPRRRGRRGGRNRRGKRGVQANGIKSAEAAPLQSSVESIHEPLVEMAEEHEEPPVSVPPISRAPVTPVSERLRSGPVRPEPRPSMPPRSSYESAAPSPWVARGSSRAGEPALASRIAQLESQVRRLLACPQASLDDPDSAPAGPGVLLLSDSDQVTHYYIESCQTLRIGIGNLLRGRPSGRTPSNGAALKERMAENLGIVESRVSKYLKDHCVVRWLQLDEGAIDLAHFAIAVLRPVVND